MKVDNPRLGVNHVICEDCPFTGANGIVLDQFRTGGENWKLKHDVFSCDENCPTLETYAEACRLAAEADEPDH